MSTMDNEIPTSTTEHIYDGLEMLVYDTGNSKSSHTSQDHMRPSATPKGQDRRRIVIYIFVVVITAGAAGVTGYYSGNLLMTTEQFSWSSWSHWTICSREHMNRIRVIPVCHDNMCNNREDHEIRQCKETGYEFVTDVRLNRSSLYQDWFISSDNLMISNVQTPDIAHRSRGIGFKEYRGAMADKCVELDEVMTFEVQYDFHITTTLTKRYSVFEIGVVELDKVDKYHYVRDYKVGGFSFYVRRHDNYTRLVAQNPTYYSVINQAFSNITKGTTRNGTLFFIIDRLSDTFSILQHHQVLYTFTKVTSTVPLCPLFGVYNADRLQTKLRLVHTTYMKHSN